MKVVLNEKGFSAIEALLIFVVVGIIGGTGFFVYHSNKNTNDTFNSASKSASSSPAKKFKPKVNSGKISTNEAIIASAKAYIAAENLSGATPLTYSVDSIVGMNAQGSIHADVGDGSIYIANKQDGKWRTVYVGHVQPGKAIGVQYGLPADWYTND